MSPTMRTSRDPPEPVHAEPRICVVGSGTKFLSGISYFTMHLAASLAQQVDVSVILMRRLIPRFLYPGRERVGSKLTSVTYPIDLPVFDGVDWFWIPSMFRAILFLRRQRPTHLVCQWWTGAVLHSFLLLALVARVLGARVIVEFHEVQDPGESRFAPARWYVSCFAGLLMRTASGFVIHSEFDRLHLEERFKIGRRPIVVIPHGPYDHHDVDNAEPLREAPDDVLNLLFFGTIRPYKGLEDLVEAFEEVCDREPDRFWLTVVGETWEGWTAPLEMIRSSRYRDRITLRNRYVTDEEVDRWFAGADAVVLPYRRSSASGPLHLSMNTGLPTVVTAVGGLPEAASDYPGALFVAPSDAGDLAQGLRRVAELRGQTFQDPHSWARSSERLLSLLASGGLPENGEQHAVVPLNSELG